MDRSAARVAAPIAASQRIRAAAVALTGACALRDSETGVELARFEACWSADWSPDGQRLLIGWTGKGYYVDANAPGRIFLAAVRFTVHPPKASAIQAPPLPEQIFVAPGPAGVDGRTRR